MEENQLKQLEESKSYVLTTCKWLKFFGIIMIICIIGMLFGSIGFFVGGSYMAQSMPEALAGFPKLIGFIYIIAAGILVIPTIYIMRAANTGKSAVLGKDNGQMVEFLKNNKSYWKFMGIYTIIAFVFVVIIFISGMISAFASLM